MRCCNLATITILLMGLNCSSKGHELKYKPFDEIVYYYDLQGDNIKISSGSPLIYRADSISKDGKFYYDRCAVSNISHPPYDISGYYNNTFPLTSKGTVRLWGEEIKFEFPQHLDASALATWTLIFPYFPKERYNVGEQWTMVLFAPITFNSALDIRFVEKMKTFFRNKSKVIYTFKSVKDMLGYQCAEIEYHIADSLRIESGEMLRFLLSGTVYFAIDEGFIVTEMMDIRHDQLNHRNDVVTVGIKRKLRMIDYKSYSGRRYHYSPQHGR